MLPIDFDEAVFDRFLGDAPRRIIAKRKAGFIEPFANHFF